MTNYDTYIVENLNTLGLPVYYELFCDSNTTKPCITYLLNNDQQEQTGTTLGYSRIQYYIKLWGSDQAVLVPKCIEIDSKMRSLGFERISMNELSDGTQICKVMLYECISLENFN